MRVSYSGNTQHFQCCARSSILLTRSLLLWWNGIHDCLKNNCPTGLWVRVSPRALDKRNRLVYNWYIRRHRLSARTLDFHSGKRGSIPLGGMNVQWSYTCHIQKSAVRVVEKSARRNAVIVGRIESVSINTIRGRFPLFRLVNSLRANWKNIGVGGC